MHFRKPIVAERRTGRGKSGDREAVKRRLGRGAGGTKDSAVPGMAVRAQKSDPHRTWCLTGSGWRKGKKTRQRGPPSFWLGQLGGVTQMTPVPVKWPSGDVPQAFGYSDT